MKRCPNPRFVAIIATALCILLIAVSGFAQSSTGNIYGKVQAKDGSVLPGVTVTLSGVGAPQNFVTDSTGNFRFLSLDPGTYTLKADLAGYGAATRQGVAVRIGQNADVTLSLNPSVSESITVTAEAPLLDVRKAGTSVSVTKVELEQIPTSRDPWTVLQSAPGVQVDRMNIGGSQSGQQSNYIGKGSSGAQNTWNVDGVNITDEGATGSSPTYYDFDAFEEMQITTGGSDPRIQTPGVQLNMVTKRGTNDIKGSSRYFYTPGSYQADASVPSEATGYLAATNAINYVRDYGLEVGGPVWKDHLWLWGAISENKISNAASVGFNVDGSVAETLYDNIILKNKNAKLNAQLAPSNSGVLFYDFGDKVRNARSLSSTRPFETAWKQTGPSKIYKLEDTQIFGSSLYLTGMASKVTGGFALDPNGGLGLSAPNAYKDENDVWHNNFSFYSTVRPQKQYRLDGSKFVDIGSMNHEFKFGFGYRSTPVSSASGFPGSTAGYYNFDPGFTCADVGVAGTDCALAVLYRDSIKGMDEKSNDLYVGDTILMGNLTLQAGLRWDVQKSKNLGSTVNPNPVVGTALALPSGTVSLPGATFSGDAKYWEWKSVSPRIGLTYALGSDKKTLLRAGYNRYVDQMGGNVLAANPFGPYYAYFGVVARDINHDKIIQRNELLDYYYAQYIDPSNPGSTTAAIRPDYNMKPPKTDEFIIGGERELMTDFTVGVNYTYRKYTDFLWTRYEKTQGAEDWYTSADYIPAGTVGGFTGATQPPNGTPTGLPSTTYYKLKAGIAAPVFGVLTNRPDYSQTYNGLELTVNKRLSNNWMMRGSFSYNDWKQHTGPDGFQDPTPRIQTATNGCYGDCNGQVFQRSAGSGAFGNVFIASKWNYNVTGLYQFPWQISVGASLNGREGYPAIYYVQQGVGAEGAKQVILGDVGDYHFDNVTNLDLRLAKEFRFFNRAGLTISADLFNALNDRTVLQRTLRTGPARATSNRIAEMQSPRVWRFGAKVSF
jgi:hypothetical protein